MKCLGYCLFLAASLFTLGFADPAKETKTPLFDGIGPYSRKVATSDSQAQKYFDQGMMFMFAFNHDEAIRAFQKATQLDPDCAMGYWGVALATGINYNDPSFTPEKAKLATDSLAQAKAKAEKEGPAHRDLIEAVAARYPDPEPKERAEAEKAYSTAMKAVWQKYPKDADIGALYAESLMNLRPWELWKEDGSPQAETPEILATLETVMKLDATHPLASHLYIHAVEASAEPGKADSAAEALRSRYPGLGHLLHMPSHIDIRRGRWEQAVDANRLAIDADTKYQKTVPEQRFYRMYMSHNHHMLAFAAMMRGQSEMAIKSMRDMLAGVPKEWLLVKENAAIVDGFAAMPIEVLKRFGRWDDILKEPEPPEIFPIARAMRHHNRGVALAAKGSIEDARAAQRDFRAAAAKPPEEGRFGNNKGVDLLAVADLMLEGEIMYREGKLKDAITKLEAAVAKEDKLRYSEPPDWFVPVRHALGAIMLRDKQAEAAEKVYREDLRRWPENGWSLHGLAQALEAQGKSEEATKVKQRFNEVWKRADVTIQSSCFCVVE